MKSKSMLNKLKEKNKIYQKRLKQNMIKTDIINIEEILKINKLFQSIFLKIR
jgi:hypothetical protein